MTGSDGRTAARQGCVLVRLFVSANAAFIYKAGKYEYPFPKDDLKRTLVAQAIEAYREDNELPENVVVTTTESTIQNR